MRVDKHEMIYNEKTGKWYIRGKKQGFCLRERCLNCGSPYFTPHHKQSDYCGTSCSQSGERNFMFGKTHSEEVREKFTGEKNGMFGRTHSDTSKKKQGESYTKSKETLKKKYGVDHNSKLDSVKDKKGQIIITQELIEGILLQQGKRLISFDGNNSRTPIIVACENEHTYKTWYSSIKKGCGCTQCYYDSIRKVGIEDISLFKRYRNIVDRLTDRVYRRYRDEINPNKYDRKSYDDGYHLDHKYSVAEGFKNNIPPYIISNKVNLEMIPFKDNLTKWYQCSITKEELFELYKREIDSEKI